MRIKPSASLVARAAGLLAAVFVAGAPGAAAAVVPGSAVVEGILTSSAGGAAADGNYKTTFSLFKDETGGNPLWSEIDVIVSVKGGVFAHALGSKSPLSQQLLTDIGGKAWLALKIESDPELPRKPLSSVVYALRAGAAESLECSGCVKAGHLDPAVLGAYAKTADLAKVAVTGDFADLKGGPDLTAYAKTASLAKVATTGAFADLTGGPDLSAYAKIAALADYAKLAALADVAKSGNYADLKGLPVLAKVGATCGTGLVVKGIKADGSYDCVVAMDPAAVPPDAIDEVSNGLLINQFQDSTSGTPDVVIKDGFLFGVADNLTFPDIGIAQKLNISVHIQNSDIGTITVSAFDPAGVEHVLYDKGAKGTELKTSFPNPTKQVTKDLTTWVGKNPKGTWTLKVVDSGPNGNTNDGKIVKWSVDVQTLSSKKVGTTGDLVLGGGLQLKVADTHPTTCDASKFGYMYANKKDNAIFVCNGTGFFPLLLSVPPGNKENPAANCNQVIVANPSAKTGSQWLDPDGKNGPIVPYEGYCEMTHAKGGWTLVFNLDTNDGSMRAYDDVNFWTNPTSLVGSVASPLTSDFKSLTHGQVPATEILIVAHNEGLDWNGKVTYVRYKLAAGHANKTMAQLMALGADTKIAAGNADEIVGAIAKNAYTRNAGDIFIDHGLPLIVNSTSSGGTAAKNTVRFGADIGPLCGQVDCNGHNVLGGYGGYHIVPSQGNYPLTYEAQPSFGYHPGDMGFGDNFVNNNGSGNSVWSNTSGPEKARLQVDFAIYVR